MGKNFELILTSATDCFMASLSDCIQVLTNSWTMVRSEYSHRKISFTHFTLSTSAPVAGGGKMRDFGLLGEMLAILPDFDPKRFLTGGVDGTLLAALLGATFLAVSLGTLASVLRFCVFSLTGAVASDFGFLYFPYM